MKFVHRRRYLQVDSRLSGAIGDPMKALRRDLMMKVNKHAGQCVCRPDSHLAPYRCRRKVLTGSILLLS